MTSTVAHGGRLPRNLLPANATIRACPFSGVKKKLGKSGN
jgi:hypothetical protein